MPNLLTTRPLRTSIKILEAQQHFYSELYTESKGALKYDCSETYLSKLDLPQISQISRENCENPITLAEIKAAIKSLPLNKSPGPDGLPIEFYTKFWNDIADIVFDNYCDSFKSGILTITQRQGIICLIP